MFTAQRNTCRHSGDKNRYILGEGGQWCKRVRLEACENFVLWSTRVQVTGKSDLTPLVVGWVSSAKATGTSNLHIHVTKHRAYILCALLNKQRRNSCPNGIRRCSTTSLSGDKMREHLNRKSDLLSTSVGAIDEPIGVGLRIFLPGKVDGCLLEGAVQPASFQYYREVLAILHVSIAVAIPCPHHDHGAFMEYEVKQSFGRSVALWLTPPLVCERLVQRSSNLRTRNMLVVVRRCGK